MPLLLLSAAASRLPASVLCVGVPVFVFCSAPLLCCPPLPDLAAPDPRCFHLYLAPPCLSVAFLVFSCPRLGASVLCPVLNLFLTFWVLLTYGGPLQCFLLPLVSAPVVFFWCFCLSVFLVCVWLLVGGPLVLCVVGVCDWGSRTRPEPWTGPHCSEFHWR